MTQFEVYKSFIFMTELLCAEALFSTTLKRKNYFLGRLLGTLAVCFLFSFLFPALNGNPLLMCFVFLCLFGFTVCAAKFLFKESWFKLLFCCVAGYTVQHLAYQVNNISVLLLMGRDLGITMGMYGAEFMPMFRNPFFTMLYFFYYISIYGICYYAFARRLNAETFELPTAFCMGLIGAILVVDVVLNAIVVYMIPDTNGAVISGVYNVICCLFGLFLQCQVLQGWGLKSRLEMERIARRFESERYAAVKEAIDTINIKWHDLKYQEWKDKAKTESALAEYGRFTYTGNVALDIVLSEINRLCQKYSIRTSYMTDGKLLEFMSDEDVYSLFGNLLNNAVEAVIKCSKDDRTMGVRIQNRIGAFLNISVYNRYIDEDIKFNENGLPETTKNQRNLHGFGLKSVQRICDKYDATMEICPENGVFCVNILLPIPKQKEKKN